MSITTSNGSLFELDRELDLLLDEIQEQAEEGGRPMYRRNWYHASSTSASRLTRRSIASADS